VQHSEGEGVSDMVRLVNCDHAYYNPDRQILLNLNGSDERPCYAIVPGEIVTANPISMHDSPLWIRNRIPRGQMGYLPQGFRIVSPFGIKYVYR